MELKIGKGDYQRRSLELFQYKFSQKVKGVYSGVKRANLLSFHSFDLQLLSWLIWSCLVASIPELLIQIIQRGGKIMKTIVDVKGHMDIGIEGQKHNCRR